MAIISYRYKFIYALAPRTASTATANYLIKNYDAEQIPNEDILDDSGNIILDKKHCTFNDLISHNILTEYLIQDFLTFVTIRNPYDSLYSGWYKKKFVYEKLLDDKNSFIYKKEGFIKDMKEMQDLSFSEWLVSRHKKLSEDSIERHLNGKYLHYADSVIRFENLNGDLQQLFEDHNIPFLGEVPVINKTEGKKDNFMNYYTSEAASVVQKAYSLDFSKFAYQC